MLICFSGIEGRKKEGKIEKEIEEREKRLKERNKECFFNTANLSKRAKFLFFTYFLLIITSFLQKQLF